MPPPHNRPPPTNIHLLAPLQVRGQQLEKSSTSSSTTTSSSSSLSHASSSLLESFSLLSSRSRLGHRVITRFQRRVRFDLGQRRLVRLVEFDAWLHECRVKRCWLAVITNLFVGALGVFTMVVCVLLSAAFDADQALKWVEAVLQSIAMQVRGVCG